MPAHHAQRRPVVVAKARQSPLWLRFAPRPDAFRARCSGAPEKLSGSEAAAGVDLPLLVRDEFDASLACGILAHRCLRLLPHNPSC